ncbi:protein CutA isoform X1 [Ahaetulla prasina]|uniref:protein CutA isoform X1 n=1 Tax=Ahaetulla prasina TaxID=499056 RepID=UPI002649B2BA|nr:protein CutA isoform X1 [Ahaetulla prasina]
MPVQRGGLPAAFPRGRLRGGGAAAGAADGVGAAAALRAPLLRLLLLLHGGRAPFFSAGDGPPLGRLRHLPQRDGGQGHRQGPGGAAAGGLRERPAPRHLHLPVEGRRRGGRRGAAYDQNTQLPGLGAGRVCPVGAPLRSGRGDLRPHPAGKPPVLAMGGRGRGPGVMGP